MIQSELVDSIPSDSEPAV